MKKNYLNFKRASLALSFMALFGATGVEAQVVVAGSATGTTATTYTSLSSAFDAINTGTHTGAITISITANVTEPTPPTPLFASGGTSSYTSVYISPSGGNFTISSAATSTANRGIIELTGADNVTINGDDPNTTGLQNLSIVSTVTTTPGIANIRLASNSATGADGASNITVMNCIIKGSRNAATSVVASYGIQFYDASGSAVGTSSIGANANTNVIIQGNTITRCAYGIHAIGNSTTYLNSGLSITSNTLGSTTATDNVSFRGIDVSYTDFNAATNTSSISLNNIIFGNTGAANPIMGIEAGNANAGLRIARNKIHDALASPFGAYGIGLTDAMSSSNGIIVRNNFIRDIKGAAVTSATAQAAGIGGIGIMVTNTVTGLIINNNSIAQQATGALGSCVQLNSADVTVSQFMNNILVNNIASAYATCFYSASTLNISGGTVNNNDYFANATANVAYYNAANRATLSAFATASGMDANSYSVMPTFVSATDLHITPGQYSALESTGAATAITNVAIDIDGDVRPGPAGSLYGGAVNPDIGADEFDGLILCGTTPTVTAVVSPTGVVCSGSSVTLTASGATTYTWSTGTTTISTSATVAINPTVTATYSVIGTTSGSCSAVGTVAIAVDNTPTLSAVPSATAVCATHTVSITASGATNYTLTSSTGTIGNGAAFTPTVADTYTITGSNACATQTTTVAISVDHTPTLSVVPGSTAVCITNNTVSITASGATNYTLTSSTGTIANGASFTPTVTDTYTITGANACASPSAAITISVDNTPTINVVPSATAVCLNHTVSITASGVTNYTLTSSTGTIGNGVAFTPTVTDTYTVTGENSCGTSSTVVTVTVNALPTLTISASNPTICSGSTVVLSVNGSGTSYTWAVNGSTNTAITVTPIPTNTAITNTFNYSVTTSNAAGCTATAVNIVTVTTTPNITPLALPINVCVGGTGTLILSGATTYTWSDASGTIANTSSVVVTPTLVPTIYTPITYSVTSANGVCASTKTVNLNLNPLPNLFAVLSNPSPSVCAGSTASMTAGGALQFTWTPATNPPNAANVTANPTITTTYTYTGFNGTCVATSTITVPVNPNPTIGIVATPTALCTGSLGNLTASGGINYTWTSSSSTQTQTGQSINVTQTVTTSYNVTGDNSFGCTSSANLVLFVNSLPTVAIAPSNTLVCLGRTVNLVASSNNAQQYHWSANAGNALTANAAVSPTATDIFTVTAINVNTQCYSMKTATVSVFNPSFTVPPSTAICHSQTLILSASGAASYTWQPGNYMGPTVPFSPSVSTIYTVVGTGTVFNVFTNSILNCQATYTLGIDVNPNPTVTAYASQSVICREETATLFASGATNYTWQPAPASGTGGTVTVNSIDFPNYINSQTYTVTGANVTGCKDKKTVTVISSGCVGIEEQSGVNNNISIYPNPNNGLFTIKSDQNINLNVVNELGQQVRTISLTESNDHHIDVSDLSNGIYFIIGSNQNGRVNQKIIISK